MNKENNNEEKIKELETRIEELENNWKRALADYKNLQKRTEEEKEAYVSFSNLILISELIPVLDNLEMVEKHLNDNGIKMIVKEFKRVLETEGLTEIEAQGKEFDPLLMEAVEKVKGYPNQVMEVTQKGYLLKNKLIRPARVKVGTQED